MKLHQETVAGLHTYADGTMQVINMKRKRPFIKRELYRHFILNTQLEKTETLNSLKV